MQQSCNKTYLHEGYNDPFLLRLSCYDHFKNEKLEISPIQCNATATQTTVSKIILKLNKHLKSFNNN